MPSRLHRASAVLLLMLAAGFARAQCPHSFAAPRPTGIPVPKTFSGLEKNGVGDFDGDGRADFAFDRAIYLSFSKRVQLPVNTPLFTEWIARVTDVNRDGRPDVLIGSALDFIALINNGDLTFTRKTTRHSSAGSDLSYVWADFNGDGLLDVFLNRSRIFLANGDGTFTEEFGSGAFVTELDWIAADVNGDHRADLIASPRSSALQKLLYLRAANGFAPPRAIPPQPPISIYPAQVAADFNGDGFEDVLFSDLNKPTLLYFDLRDLSPRSVVSLPFGSYTAADFNGDGAPDLFLRAPSGARKVFINDGLGNFRVTQELQGIELMTVADADGDGRADLVASDAADIFILHGNGDGTFNVPQVALAASDSGTSGDFDGDGDDDVALPTAIGWNNGDNTFRLVPTSDARLKRPVRAVDLDGDGKAEVISIATGAVLALSLRPDGSIVEVAFLPIQAVDVAVGDFSGNHRPELAAVIGLVIRYGVEVYELRTGAAPRFSVVTSTAQSVGAADLNGDGVDDLVVGGGTVGTPSLVGGVPGFSRDGFLSTFISTGTSFGAEQRVSLPFLLPGLPYPGLHELVSGDFDGDGKRDVAATTLHSGREVMVLFGDGSGGFPRMQRLPLTSSELNFSLRAADLDGDGRTDLAVNGAWRIFAGAPNGVVERGRYLTPLSPNPDFDDITFVPLLVRPRRDALPWIIVPTQFAPDAFLYRPVCPRARSARH